MFGAIGSNLKSVFHVADSTNRVDFQLFFSKIVAWVGTEKPFLVYDNHSAHLTIENREYISQHFRQLKMPPYSCQFNSIETLWAHLKRIFRDLDMENVKTTP